MFKKIINLILIFVLLFPNIIIPSFKVKAETLGDVERELEAYKQAYLENQEKRQQTEEEMAATRQKIINANNDIVKVNNDILEANNEIDTLNEEIETLNIEIAEKEKQIKDIMNFFQKSNGESAYLEYMFGAKSFTDFIYRMAISEQLTDYNKTLINEFNKKIDENNKKKKELEDKTKELENKKIELKKLQDSLETLYSSLSGQLSGYVEDQVDIEEEIRMKEDAIQMYKDMGCKSEDDIDVCTREKLPKTTELFRPLVVGRVTQEFGYPDYDTSGFYSFHGAIDVSTYDDNTPVYAAGNGLVVAISRNQRCGSNIVYIQHQLYNGDTYTTAYWHLRRVFVSEGDQVTRDTQIGIMGGAPWDGDICSTGAHVHFIIATGLYLQDYYYISTLNARRINPRTLVNFPAIGVQFTDRYIKY